MTRRRDGGDPGAGSQDPGACGEASGSGGAPRIEPSEELEQALREAAEAVERREAEQAAASGASEPAAAQTGGEGGESQAAAGAESTAAAPDELARELETVRRELAETEERMLRLAADFENFRRRALRERQEAQLYGHQNLIKDLLATVDNLERAIDHAGRDGGANAQGLLEGVELVLRELKGTLAKYGVSEVEAEGQPFDPAVHEAMAQAEDDSVPPQTVVQVLQKGYRLRDRLLRPARVVVSKRSESAAAAADPERQQD